MQRIFIVLVMVVLGGCASVPPLAQDEVSKIMQGKTAVIFSDDIQQINYLEDKYFVLGVAQVASNSAYKDIWNSNELLSSVHSQGLARAGLHTESVYELMPAETILELTKSERERYTLIPKKASKEQKVTQTEAPLTPSFRDALLAKGKDYLVWIGWGGFTLHLPALGLSPVEQFQTGFWIFDVKSNKLLWNGSVFTAENVKIEGTGKEFLESNNLSRLRSEVSNRINERYSYRPKATGMFKNSYGQLIGLEKVEK